MTIATQLQEIIDGVARSGALTPDAIRQFDEHRKRSEKLEADLETRTKERDEARASGSKTSSALHEANEKITALTKRAEAAEAKNLAADKAIWIADFERQRREEMRSIVSDVFRNAEIQRLVSHSQPMVLPPSYPGGASTVQYSSDVKTETETRK